jgi:8-oxo-dGTP pyrophosphatase MutT (NUDIX family)
LDPPPWAHAPDGARAVDLDRVVRAMAAAPPPTLVRLAGKETRLHASVLLPVYEEVGEAWLLMIRRSAAMRRNAGDVAFPGGQREPGEDATTAALREAWEEIGLDPGAVTVVGRLDGFVNFAGIEITPIVGVLPGRPASLVADVVEVDAVLSVRLADLLDLDRYRGERWGDDESRDMHEFDIEGDTIWGATARVLHRFLSLVTGV